MSHCSDCGRNLSESGGGDCETCSGVCEPKEPTLADVDVIEVINTLPRNSKELNVLKKFRTALIILNFIEF